MIEPERAGPTSALLASQKWLLSLSILARGGAGRDGLGRRCLKQKRERRFGKVIGYRQALPDAVLFLATVGRPVILSISRGWVGKLGAIY